MERENSFTIYPNPVTNGIINLHFAGMREGSFTTILTNAVGQVLIEKQFIHSVANNTYTIVVSNLIKGVCQLQIVQPGQLPKTWKILLQ